MKDVMHFIREYTVWLHQTIIEYGLFYIDLWSLVHFWSGMIIFVSLTALGWKKRWQWLAFFLTAFEVVEATIFISILKMFMPEKLPDSFNDIFIGLAGGYLVYYLFEKKKISGIKSRLFLYWLAAGTVSFVWTGNHGYVFNNQFFNTPGLNWLMFLFWMVVGGAVLLMFDKMKTMYSKAKSVALVWFAYVVPVFFVFRTTAAMFAGEETTMVNKNHFSGMATGNGMNFFHFTAPFFFLLVYFLLNRLFERYRLKSVENEVQ